MTHPLPEHERTTRETATVLAGRYELRGILGRGGMSEVHRAHDRALDRTVAVKLLSAERRDDPEYAVRLRGEAKAAAALLHPNAVPVFDVGTAGDDVFVVMEFVEGRSLRDELRSRGRLPAGEAAAAAAAVGDALAAAHERGIVHRDVNPGNVMRCADGTVKLMDFGIARLGTSDGRLTETGVVIGTAAYMAPEQVRGDTLDGQADQYALGCSLYELVTGELPFSGGSGVELAAIRLRERPAPPRTLVPSLPDALDRAIMRSLALEPTDRFRDVGAMAAALRTAVGSGAAGSSGSSGSSGSRSDAITVPRQRTGTDSTEVFDADLAPDAGEAEPWSVVRRIGLALVGLAVLVMLVVGLVVVLRA